MVEQKPRPGTPRHDRARGLVTARPGQHSLSWRPIAFPTSCAMKRCAGWAIWAAGI